MIRIELDSEGWDAALRAAIEQLSGPQPEAQITNDVPYVPKLEYGSSRQAPHGMVRVSIPEIRKMLLRMMQSFNVLREAANGTLRATIADRINRTADFGHGLIRDRTPIRTGRARRGWVVKEAE